MKKEYMKPEQRIVVLQHRTQLLTVSGVSATGLGSDNLSIDENEAGSGFCGR